MPCEPLPEPEWFDRRPGVYAPVAVSVALLIAVVAVGWGNWTGQTVAALLAALVALALSLWQLVDVVRRERAEPPPTVIPLTRRRP